MIQQDWSWTLSYYSRFEPSALRFNEYYCKLNKSEFCLIFVSLFLLSFVQLVWPIQNNCSLKKVKLVTII